MLNQFILHQVTSGASSLKDGVQQISNSNGIASNADAAIMLSKEFIQVMEGYM